MVIWKHAHGHVLGAARKTNEYLGRYLVKNKRVTRQSAKTLVTKSGGDELTYMPTHLLKIFALKLSFTPS